MKSAAQDRSDLPVEAHDADCPCESCEEFERLAGGSVAEGTPQVGTEEGCG